MLTWLLKDSLGGNAKTIMIAGSFQACLLNFFEWDQDAIETCDILSETDIFELNFRV